MSENKTQDNNSIERKLIVLLMGALLIKLLMLPSLEQIETVIKNHVLQHQVDGHPNLMVKKD